MIIAVVLCVLKCYCINIKIYREILKGFRLLLSLFCFRLHFMPLKLDMTETIQHNIKYLSLASSLKSLFLKCKCILLIKNRDYTIIIQAHFQFLLFNIEYESLLRIIHLNSQNVRHDKISFYILSIRLYLPNCRT